MGLLDFLFKKNEVKQAQTTTCNNEVKQTKKGAYVHNIIGKYYRLEQLQSINMGDIVLRPIDGGLALEEGYHKYLKMMTNLSPNIQRFLPYLNWNSESDIQKFFLKFCNLCELGYKFGYSIHNREGHILGLIFIYTPDYNQNSIHFSKWTMDFLLFSPFEGQGIMPQILGRVLYTLKETFKVEKLYAYTDKQNSRCLKVLNKLPFDLEEDTLRDPQTGNQAMLYSIELSTINFQRR